MKINDIVNELQDLVHSKCERAWVQYYRDTRDVVLEYKGWDIAEFKDFDPDRFDTKGDIVDDDFPLFTILDDEFETGVLSAFYNKGKELLKKYNAKRYTIRVFPDEPMYGFLNVNKNNGRPAISDCKQVGEYQTKFTRKQIEELKKRDDIAVDWDKVELEEVNDA